MRATINITEEQKEREREHRETRNAAFLACNIKWSTNRALPTENLSELHCSYNKKKKRERERDYRGTIHRAILGTEYKTINRTESFNQWAYIRVALHNRRTQKREKLQRNHTSSYFRHRIQNDQKDREVFPCRRQSPKTTGFPTDATTRSRQIRESTE